VTPAESERVDLIMAAVPETDRQGDELASALRVNAAGRLRTDPELATQARVVADAVGYENGRERSLVTGAAAVAIVLLERNSLDARVREYLASLGARTDPT